jgi:hypothetical protein
MSKQQTANSKQQERFIVDTVAPEKRGADLLPAVCCLLFTVC